MQWLIQDDEDTSALAEMLERMGITYSLHTRMRDVAVPEPVIEDPNRVVVFGYYSMQAFSKARGYKPGVFELDPYVLEEAWQPYLLNPRADATFMKVSEIGVLVAGDGRRYFVRPVEDSKTMSGKVMTGIELRAKADEVMAVPADQHVPGRIAPDTELLLSTPVGILKEWRVWIVAGKVVTYSLYKMAGKMVVRPEIDDDALAFVKEMIAVNPDYATAYVIDVCRADSGLRIIETNCINASGFYEANLQKLIEAIEDL